MALSSPRSHSDIRGVSAADLVGESVDLGADGQRLRPVVEQPASGAVDEPAQVQRHAVGDGDRNAVVAGRTDLPPHLPDAEDRVGGDVAAHRVDRADTDVLGDPVGVGDARGVDEIVDQHGGDDLPAQLMRADVGDRIARAGSTGSTTAAGRRTPPGRAGRWRAVRP